MEREQKSASEMKVKRGNTGAKKGSGSVEMGNRGGWRWIEQNEVCVLKLLGNLWPFTQVKGIK